LARPKDYVKLLTQVSKVAPTDSTVLILGETGTGKELICAAHFTILSKRSTRAFISCHLRRIPLFADLAVELFGHEMVPFTGHFSEGGMAAQLTRMKARVERLDRL